jgi:hypothetical protein
VNALFLLKHLLIAAAALPLLLAGRQAKPDDEAAQTRISTVYRADKAACVALSGQASDLCFEQARARMKVARADSVPSRTQTPAAAEIRSSYFAGAAAEAALSGAATPTSRVTNSR